MKGLIRPCQFQYHLNQNLLFTQFISPSVCSVTVLSTANTKYGW